MISEHSQPPSCGYVQPVIHEFQHWMYQQVMVVMMSFFFLSCQNVAAWTADDLLLWNWGALRLYWMDQAGQALMIGQLLPQRRGLWCCVSQHRLIIESRLGSVTTSSCTTQHPSLLLIYYQQHYLFMSTSLTCARLWHSSVYGGCVFSFHQSIFGQYLSPCEPFEEILPTGSCDGWTHWKSIFIVKIVCNPELLFFFENYFFPCSWPQTESFLMSMLK